MTDVEFKGVIVPAITPFTPDEEVDVPSLRRHVDYLVSSGVHGIWAAGTTGEFAALSDEQRLLVIETVLDEVAGRVPVIANVSAPATRGTVALAMHLQESGLDGIAATPPYYYPCEQDEMLAHFDHIASRSGLPLWVYNIPVTVKTAVAPATIARLSGDGAVVGVKDSSGAGELLAELNFLCEAGGLTLWRFLGSIFRTASTRGVGAHGVIPGLSNLVPGIAVKAWEAAEAGDAGTAQHHLARLVTASRIMKLAGGGGPNASTFSGIKAGLKHLGIIEHDTVSRPLRPLTSDEKQQIPALLKEIGVPE